MTKLYEIFTEYSPTTPVYSGPSNIHPQHELRYGTSMCVMLRDNLPPDHNSRGDEMIVELPVKGTEGQEAYLRKGLSKSDLGREPTVGEMQEMLRRELGNTRRQNLSKMEFDERLDPEEIGKEAKARIEDVRGIDKPFKIGETVGEKNLPIYIGDWVEQNQVNGVKLVEREVGISKRTIREVMGERAVKGLERYSEDKILMFGLVGVMILVIIFAAILTAGWMYTTRQKARARMSEAEARIEEEKTRQLEDETIQHLNTPQETDEVDITGDGEPDIKTVVMGDGDVIEYGLTEAGRDELDGEVQVTERGMSVHDYLDIITDREETRALDMDIPWGWVIGGTVVVVGIYAFMRARRRGYQLPYERRIRRH